MVAEVRFLIEVHHPDEDAELLQGTDQVVDGLVGSEPQGRAHMLRCVTGIGIQDGLERKRGRRQGDNSVQGREQLCVHRQPRRDGLLRPLRHSAVCAELRPA